MQYKKIICKYCGKSAVVSTLRKTDYCNNCKTLAHNELSRKYYQRKSDDNQVMSPNEFAQKSVSTVAFDLLGDPRYNKYKERINKLLENDSKSRNEWIELQRDMRNDIDHLTKSRDMLMHKLEFEKYTMSDEQKLLGLNKVQDDGITRRILKDELVIVDTMVSSHEVRNPKTLATKVRNATSKTTDLRGYVEELRSDPEVFAYNRESKTYNKKK